MPHIRTVLLVSGALMLLPGCATNSFRLERASAVGEAARAASEGTSALIRDANRANRQTAIDVATIDPNCRLPEPVIGLGAPRSKTLCRAGEARPGDVPLTRFRPATFAPALATLEALGEYVGAIDAIVADDPIDFSGLAVAQDGLQAIGGPSLNPDQRAAVDGAIALIAELVTEADKVRRLRDLSLPQDSRADFEKTATALRQANATWTGLLGIELDNQSVARRELSREVRGGASIAERRALREQEMALVEQQTNVPAVAAALDRSVDVLIRAHNAYLDLLAGDRSKLSASERRREGAIIRKRVLAALQSIRDLVKAF